MPRKTSAEKPESEFSGRNIREFISERLHGIFKHEGFKKTGTSWVRDFGDTFVMVRLDKSRFANNFQINIWCQLRTLMKPGDKYMSPPHITTGLSNLTPDNATRQNVEKTLSFSPLDFSSRFIHERLGIDTHSYPKSLQEKETFVRTNTNAIVAAVEEYVIPFVKLLESKERIQQNFSQIEELARIHPQALAFFRKTSRQQ